MDHLLDTGVQIRWIILGENHLHALHWRMYTTRNIDAKLGDIVEEMSRRVRGLPLHYWLFKLMSEADGT